MSEVKTNKEVVAYDDYFTPMYFGDIVLVVWKDKEKQERVYSRIVRDSSGQYVFGNLNYSPESDYMNIEDASVKDVLSDNSREFLVILYEKSDKNEDYINSLIESRAEDRQKIYYDKDGKFLKEGDVVRVELNGMDETYYLYNRLVKTPGGRLILKHIVGGSNTDKADYLDGVSLERAKEIRSVYFYDTSELSDEEVIKRVKGKEKKQMSENKDSKGNPIKFNDVVLVLWTDVSEEGDTNEWSYYRVEYGSDDMLDCFKLDFINGTGHLGAYFGNTIYLDDVLRDSTYTVLVQDDSIKRMPDNKLKMLRPGADYSNKPALDEGSGVHPEIPQYIVEALKVLYGDNPWIDVKHALFNHIVDKTEQLRDKVQKLDSILLTQEEK